MWQNTGKKCFHGDTVKRDIYILNTKYKHGYHFVRIIHINIATELYDLGNTNSSINDNISKAISLV